VSAARFPNDGEGISGDPIAAVAHAAQESLMEWQFHAWPLCDEHNAGLHAFRVPGLADGQESLGRGPASWWCALGGGHRVAAIGRLGLGAT
jgi:hypothetical protein